VPSPWWLKRCAIGLDVEAPHVLNGYTHSGVGMMPLRVQRLGLQAHLFRRSL
jgi:hypothetical protein